MLKSLWNSCRRNFITIISNKYESFPKTLIKSQKPCRLVHKKLIAVKKRAPTRSQQKWTAECRAGQNDINWNTAYMLAYNIVVIRNWLGSPANFKGTNKDQRIYVGRSTTLHNLLFCTHTLWPNYVTVTFLLVSSSGTNHDLCVCAGSWPKKRTKT